nr:MAG TPA: hypothetical protein [Microviridae sp.]
MRFWRPAGIWHIESGGNNSIKLILIETRNTA